MAILNDLLVKGISRFIGPVTADEIRGLGANYYGVCATAAATNAKVVTCEGFVLKAGVRISVRFTNGSTSSGTMSLNVNGTGAKNCGAYFHNGLWISESLICNKNDVLEFIYNGTYWVALTPYSLRNFATYYSRLTSANRSNPNMGLEYFSATSAMTTGKPPIDASILNMNWDNGSTYAAQLAVGMGSSSVTTPGRIFSRGQLGTAATWSDWKEVPRLSGALTNGQIVISDESTGTALLKGGPAFGTGTTKFLREDGTWQVPSGGGGSSESEGTFTVTDGVGSSDTWSYYKIGKQVTVSGKYTGSSTALSLQGLPFTVKFKQAFFLPVQITSPSFQLYSCQVTLTAGAKTIGTYGYGSNPTSSWLSFAKSAGTQMTFSYITDD